MKLTLFVLSISFLAAGCATRGDAPLARASGPSITDIVVADNGSKELDFVLINVRVLNPEVVDAQGIIACLKDHKIRQRPVQHRFDVEPEKQSQYRVPVDALQASAYTLRCRLEFQDDLGNAHREPSPWVRVQVPAQT